MVDRQGGLVRSFLYISSGNLSRIALHLLYTPIIVRLLGVRYGDYAFMLSILGLTIIAIDSGVFPGARKFLAERRDHPDWTRHVATFYLLFTVITVALVSVVLLGAVWSGFVVRHLPGEFAIYFGVLVLVIIARSFYTLTRSILIGLHREDLSEPLYAGKKLVFGAVGLGLAYLGWDVLGLLVGHLIANVVVLSAMILVGARLVSFDVRSFLGADFPGREVLSFTLLSVLLYLLMSTLLHVDILLLRLLTDAEQTSYYKAALLAAEFLWVIPIALQLTLVHSTSELWSDGQVERVNRISARITRYTLLLSLLFGLGIAALAEEAIGLYFGSEFVPAALPMVILLPGAIGFAVARTIFSIGHGKGDLRLLIYATGAAALLNLMLNLILIPRFGMIGAAVATSVGYGSMLVFHVLAAHRIGFRPLADLRLSRVAVTAGGTGAVLFGLSATISEPWLALIVLPPIGLVAFASIAFYAGALETAEVRAIVSGIRSSVASES